MSPCPSYGRYWLRFPSASLVGGWPTAAIGSDAGIPGQSDSSAFFFLANLQLGNYSDTLSSFASPTRLPPATTLPVTSHGDRLTLPRYFIASLLPHFAQEALPVGNRTAKILRDGLPHIRQCVPHSQVHARPASRRIRQNRHILPRMVRRRPARIGIAAVICGDHHHVGQTQQRQELRKRAVKFFQRFGESLHVFPVAVQHVEIHQVAKNESALAFADRRRQFFHAVGVALCRHVFFDSAAVVNVMNLANSENANFTLRENIHQHRLRRIYRIIMPPRRPNIMSGHSREWPRDHPSHAVRPIQQFPCDLAHAVELGNWNHLFMRGDLKHAIATHEEVIPVAELYRMCEIARKLLDGPHRVGRVIARPFTGMPGHYVRTTRRHDYAVDPPKPMLMDVLAERKVRVFGVGKINDIYNVRVVE